MTRKDYDEMKIENDKIISATEMELYEYWLKRELYDVYGFPEYLERMRKAGVVIEDED